MVQFAAPSLVDDILRLKKERNAVILAHNYQVRRSRNWRISWATRSGSPTRRRRPSADVIAFCGVHFMAETAKIVNPKKIVVLPDANAGCSLEQSCPGPQLEKFLQVNAAKNYYVIAYINCSAAVKALSDCICTSGNAVKIVEAAPKDRPILFVPDQNLGAWVMEQTGRKMDLWQGACYVHVEFTRDSINAIKARASRRAGGGASRVHLRGADAGRRSVQHGEDGGLLPQQSGARPSSS